MPADEKLSDSLERWLQSPEPKTIGSLVELFGEKSFAVLFVLLLEHRLCWVVFRIVVLTLTLAAFLAPPFTGRDTLPSLGGVLIVLGGLLEDPLLGIAGAAIGAAGVIIAIVLGRAAIEGLRS